MCCEYLTLSANSHNGTSKPEERSSRPYLNATDQFKSFKLAQNEDGALHLRRCAYHTITKSIPTMRSLRWFTCLVTMASSAAVAPPLRGARLLQTTPSALTTTNCNAIRQEDYQAELQLVYEYLVEFKKGGSRSLHGIETAITHAVAQNLDTCDALDRPLYKIKANTRHTFSKTGTSNVGL
jgi:hypothetical protein